MKYISMVYSETVFSLCAIKAAEHSILKFHWYVFKNWFSVILLKKILPQGNVSSSSVSIKSPNSSKLFKLGLLNA